MMAQLLETKHIIKLLMLIEFTAEVEEIESEIQRVMDELHITYQLEKT